MEPKFLINVWKFCLISLIFSISLAAKTPPNIVFILADDLGYNDIGYAQYSDVKTPVLDKLANQGLKLNYSYTQFVCSPSRASILTGLYPFRYGFQGGAIKPDEPKGLDLELQLLPERLKKLGYQTHLVGKWHLGLCKTAYTPRQRGFDTFRGFLGGSEDYYTHKCSHGKAYDYWHNENILYSHKYSTDDFRNYTVNLIEESGDTKTKPVFLFLSMQSIHAPLNLPPNVEEGDYDNRGSVREILKNLDSFTDHIVKALKSAKLWDNTVLIFSSDNGAYPNYGGNNYPLRGTKHSVWEGGVRVRTFLTGRDIERGEYGGLFHSVDWTPTILAMADGNAAKKLSGLDGINQWEALKQNEDSFENQPRKSFIYNYDKTGCPKNEFEAAVRMRTEENGKMQDFKLIVGHPGKYGGRYKPGEKIKHTKAVYFKDPVLFNMNVEDEKLEEAAHTGEDANDIKTKMLELLENEVNKGEYLDTIEKESVAKAWNNLDWNGNPILGPGWC